MTFSEQRITVSNEDLTEEQPSQSVSEEEELYVQVGGDTPDVLLEFQRKRIERQSEEIENIKQDRSQRKSFSYYIFGFMCLYMAASITIVFLCGFNKMCLKESILITLLTTTLANVIGIFNFVAKYLFHK